MNNTFRNNNSNYQRPQGKEDVPNKIKFSSVKLGETKQGSPTVGLYLKRDQLEKLVTLGAELLEAGEDGCKIGCIVISGKSYDSGYAYVNPKEKRENNDNGQTNQNKGGFRKQAGPSKFGNKDSARAFLKSKRLDDGEETQEGN